MVAAMLCTMIPAAFAATTSSYTWDTSDLDTEGMVKWLLVCYQYGHTPSGSGSTTTCKICGATGTRYSSGSGSSSGSYDDGIVWDYSDTCYDDDNPSWSHRAVYWKTVGNYDYYYCRYCNEEGYALRDSYVADDGLELNPTDNLNAGDTYEENETGVYVKVAPKIYGPNNNDITSRYDISYNWSGDYKTAPGSSSDTAYLNTALTSCTISVKVTATPKSDYADLLTTLTGTCEWYATCGTAINVSATVYNTTDGYVLSDDDDEGGTSVEEQINSEVYALGSRSDDFELDHVVFGSVSQTGGKLDASTSRSYYYYNASASSYNYYLSDVTFTPTAGYTGSVSFPFTAYYYDGRTLKDASGTLTFEVKAGAAGLGVVYTALSGQNVELDEDDFVDFWEATYPYGTLNYVKFDTISTAKGKLWDGYDTTSAKQVTGSTYCYYDPTARQVGLNDLTFVPRSSSVTSVELTFTASGTNNYNRTASLSGSITILYTDAEVTPIQYEVTTGGVALSADDFVAKYKEVMGVKTANASSLTIQFLDAPAYGTLYLNYNANSYLNTGTALTEKNVLNYTFSGNTRATRSISDLTYVPGTYTAAAESLQFACYYGNQLKFVGTVTFGSADPIEIEYVTSGATAVNFKASDFYTVNSSELLTASYVTFGTPTTGTLYKNYNSGTGIGTRVGSYDSFTFSTTTGTSLSSVTFVPYANYVGVAEIPFYAYTTRGTQIKGTVKVYVGRVFTDITGAGFTWAVPYINKLSAQGIVSGKSLNTFGPNDQVKYGEALKLIMMAAGYSDQVKTGSHWASGFLTKAYADGLVSTANIDLEKTITREEIATITAKALKLNYATSVSYGVVKPSDTTNGYVYALYNAGIVGGSNVGTTNYFYGSQAIKRSEIAKIICNVADYEA